MKSARVVKGARCTNYGDCQAADTGKRVGATICPECGRPTIGPRGFRLAAGPKVFLVVSAGLVVFGAIAYFGAGGVWQSIQDHRLASFLGTESDAKISETESNVDPRKRGSRNPQGMPEGMLPPSWWQRVWGLPSDGDMRRALQREIKPGVKIKKIKLVAQKDLGGGKHALEYEVTARIERTVFTVASKKAVALKGRKLDPGEQDLLKDLILAPNLPPGQFYDWDHKEVLENPTESAIFSWNVSEAEKVGGQWIPIAWEPFPMEKHPILH